MVFNNIFTKNGVGVILNGFNTTAKRFPFTLGLSTILTIILLVLANNFEPNKDLGRLVLSLFVVYPMVFAIEFTWPTKNKIFWIWLLALVVFSCAYYFFVPIENEYKESDRAIIITCLTVVSMHLLAAVFPYLQKGSIDNFWQFNKVLFLSFLQAGIYAICLAVGLSLAVLAINKLFGLSINDVWYRRIFISCAMFVHSNIFLNQIPAQSQVDQNAAYPNGLKYFVLYVLLPLVSIYLTILLSYQIKILITWTLPKGWVSTLVLASGIFGILAFLLLYPLQKNNLWVARYHRYYYMILLPLTGLLLVAIFTRIATYGLTPPRFIVAVLGVWLLGVSIYFLWSKVDNIKIIPLSLSILGLWAAFGPYNAVMSSTIHQKARLTAAMANHTAKKSLDNASKKKMAAAIDYLSTHDLASLAGFLPKNEFQKLVKLNPYDRSMHASKFFGVEQSYAQGQFKFVHKIQTDVEPVYNADYRFYFDGYNNRTLHVDQNNIVVETSTLKNNGQATFIINNKQYKIDFNKIKSFAYEVPLDSLTFKLQTTPYQIIVVIDNAVINDANNFDSLIGNVYLKK